MPDRLTPEFEDCSHDRSENGAPEVRLYLIELFRALAAYSVKRLVVERQGIAEPGPKRRKKTAYDEHGRDRNIHDGDFRDARK